MLTTPVASNLRIIVWLGLGLGLFVLALQPAVGGSLTFYYLLLKLIVLTQSMNIIAGYTGYIDFGHVVWFGLGTYTAGTLLRSFPATHAAPLALALVGGLLAAGIASLVGLPLLRLRGSYFAISMLVFNEAVRVLVILLEPWTGGVHGIPLPRIYDPVGGYYSMLLLAVLTILFVRILATSRFGIALKAIREDEDAAAAMGLNTTRLKVSAFALSAFVAGAAGSIDFAVVAYTAPELVFNVAATIEMVVMMMFGGAGTVLGPVLGATSLYFVRDYFWARFPFIYFMLFGGVIIASVLLMPRGILGLVEQRVPALRARIR